MCLLLFCVGFVIFDVIFRKKNMAREYKFFFIRLLWLHILLLHWPCIIRFAFFASGVSVVVAAVEDVFTYL